MALVSHVVFERFSATIVLHFPATSECYGGNPLSWTDWTVQLELR